MNRKILNFAHIRFPKDSQTYGLYVIPYKDEHQLKEMRKEHNGTNSFFRHGDSIYHSPMIAEGGYREGEYRMFGTNKDTEVTHSRFAPPFRVRFRGVTPQI
jgi:hypothetical protein